MNIGTRIKTAAVAALCGGSLMVTAGLGTAQAQPAPPPPPGADGMVNVVVGGATVLDSVPDSQAVQAVTDMCALPAPAVDAMVSAVDAAGGSKTACAGRSGGDVVLVQNLPPALEKSPVVPGTSASFGSAGGSEPAAPAPIAGSLPTEPDNMSSEN
jgi:hypothetical protein